MRLIDTVKNDENPINGMIGVFRYLASLGVLEYTTPFEYYYVRSGLKTAVRIYDEIDTELAHEYLSGAIASKFGHKWLGIFRDYESRIDVLKDVEYTDELTATKKKITTYNTTTQKTINDTHSVTYGSVINKTSSDEQEITYDTTTQDEGKTSTNLTTTNTGNSVSKVYGFNSIEPVGDRAGDNTETEAVVGSADDNTNNNTQTKTGTEAKATSITGNETKSGSDSDTRRLTDSDIKSGTDTDDYIISDTHTIEGYKNNPLDNIIKDIDLRTKYLIAEIIYSDIDSVLTQPMYERIR